MTNSENMEQPGNIIKNDIAAFLVTSELTKH